MEFSDIIWMFVNPFEAIRGVRDFLEMGGDVLMLIMLETLVLWLLIFERSAIFAAISSGWLKPDCRMAAASGA